MTYPKDPSGVHPIRYTETAITHKTLSYSIDLITFTNWEQDLIVTYQQIESNSQYVIPANTYYTELISGQAGLWYSTSFFFDSETGNGREFCFINYEFRNTLIKNMNVKSVPY